VQIGIGKVFGLNVFANAPDLFLRIDEGKILRDALAANNTDFLAEGFQETGHAKATAQGVAVGTDVAGENDVVGFADDFAETFPVDLHEIAL